MNGTVNDVSLKLLHVAVANAFDCNILQLLVIWLTVHVYCFKWFLLK